jgi:thiamine biosynthesis lipoprotein
MWWITVLTLLVLLPGFTSTPSLERFEFTETHMGTQFRMVVYAADLRSATLASSAAFERVAKLDAIMSDYRETSELNRLCRRPAGSKTPVSEDLFRVLTHSQRLSRRSKGAFDVTAGPLIRLWRHARRTGEFPGGVEDARKRTGYSKLHLDRASRSVSLETAGMQLDLGGIAKGYAVDEAMLVLKRRGIQHALIAAGGDILVSESPPGTQGWTVGIARLESSEPERFLLLRNRAVSTSGDLHQYVEIGGVRYSHIIDPRTGVGLTGRSSVTVVARDCTTSDGLATAASVLGARDGSRLLDSTPGAAGFFVRETGEEKSVIETSRWRRIPKASSSPFI